MKIKLPLIYVCVLVAIFASADVFAATSSGSAFMVKGADTLIAIFTGTWARRIGTIALIGAVIAIITNPEMNQFLMRVLWVVALVGFLINVVAIANSIWGSGALV